MNGLAIIAVVAAIIGLVVAVGLASWISKADEGNDRMKEIAGFIREGAMAFLAREYKVMVIVIAVLFLLIGFFISCDHRYLVCVRCAAVCTGRLLRNEGGYAG